MRRRVALLLCLGLAACGTTQADLTYAPPSPLPPRPGVRPVVTITQVVDRREEARTDPHWIGAVRTDYGASVKDLRTQVPAADEVRQAFSDALQARGLLAPEPASARYSLDVDILGLEARQISRRAGTAQFRITLRSINGGGIVLVDQEDAAFVSSDLIMPTSGVFSASEPLRQITQRAMSEAIDRLLDKPSFAMIVQHGWGE